MKGVFLFLQLVPIEEGYFNPFLGQTSLGRWCQEGGEIPKSQNC